MTCGTNSLCSSQHLALGLGLSNRMMITVFRIMDAEARIHWTGINIIPDRVIAAGVVIKFDAYAITITISWLTSNVGVAQTKLAQTDTISAVGVEGVRAVGSKLKQ
jgi:hypothetical protein